jgi:hypothetical protein
VAGVEHIVDCSAQRTDHSAVDEDLTDARWVEFTVPAELTASHIEERQRKVRAALDRLQAAALTDDQLCDLLTVLGIEDA